MWQKAAFVLTLALVTVAQGADPVVPASWPKPFPIDAAPEIKIDPASARLVKDLASTDFTVRERAIKELETDGIGMFPMIREAAKASNDPEVMARLASWLNVTFRFPSNLPAHTMDELAHFQRSLAAVKANDRSVERFNIHNSNLFGESGDLFFRIALAQETDPEALSALKEEMSNRRIWSARQAIASGQFDQAEEILRGNLSDTGADYAALRALRAGNKLDPDAEMQSLTNLHLHPVTTNEVTFYMSRAARSPKIVDQDSVPSIVEG